MEQEVLLWEKVIISNALRIARDLVQANGVVVLSQEFTVEGGEEFIGVQCEPLHTSMRSN